MFHVRLLSYVLLVFLLNSYGFIQLFQIMVNKYFLVSSFFYIISVNTLSNFFVWSLYYENLLLFTNLFNIRLFLKLKVD